MTFQSSECLLLYSYFSSEINVSQVNVIPAVKLTHI